MTVVASVVDTGDWAEEPYTTATDGVAVDSMGIVDGSMDAGHDGVFIMELNSMRSMLELRLASPNMLAKLMFPKPRELLV